MHGKLVRKNAFSRVFHELRPPGSYCQYWQRLEALPIWLGIFLMDCIFGRRLYHPIQTRSSRFMETEWVALDLRIQNWESADPRDGSFVMIRSPTTFGNKR